jgi:hypothetical protein
MAATLGYAYSRVVEAEMNRCYLAIFAALMLLGSTSALAATQTLDFTFGPLECTQTYNFPGIPPSSCGSTSLTGSFTFNDADGDGHVVISELLYLQMRGIFFTAPTAIFPLGNITDFDYASSTGLRFSATRLDQRVRVITGDSFRYDSPGGSTIEAWLPSTTLTISPIPEPTTLLLWMAGGCAVAWRARRKAH